MDGSASGRIKCTLANWTGVAYRIPRTAIDLCRERDDLKQSGVYFLFGLSDSEEDTTDAPEQIIYIGQAGVRKSGEGILYRLQEHKKNPDKDYWSEAVVFTTSNNSFGPTEISYLENRFCSLANTARRYIVKNLNEPTHGNVTEEKESELEEFIEYARIIMGVFGHKVFEPFIVKKPVQESRAEVIIPNQSPLFYINRRNAHAIGTMSDEGFIVAAGSILSDEITLSCPQSIKKMRKSYKRHLDEKGSLTKDILFRSPSAAASFVLGISANGNTEWKTETGIPLGKYEGSEDAHD